MVVFGIDLRASPDHASAVAALDEEARACHLGTFHAKRELLELLEVYQPSLIAIGAPLNLPSGLCCLEAKCDCEFDSPLKKGRQAELELSRMGISCFFTNKRSIIRKLIYRSIKLNRSLILRKYQVIEVYPYATKVIIFGDKVPPKNSARSLLFMKERLPAMIGGLDPYLDSLNRNNCDALINAYTALLHCRNSTDLLGNPEEGLLALPKLPC